MKWVVIQLVLSVTVLKCTTNRGIYWLVTHDNQEVSIMNVIGLLVMITRSFIVVIDLFVILKWRSAPEVHSSRHFLKTLFSHICHIASVSCKDSTLWQIHLPALILNIIAVNKLTIRILTARPAISENLQHFLKSHIA